MMQASHSYSEVAIRFQSCSTGEVVLHNFSINLIPNLALRLLVIGVLGGDPKLLPKSHLKSRCIFFLLFLVRFDSGKVFTSEPTAHPKLKWCCSFSHREGSHIGKEFHTIIENGRHFNKQAIWKLH